VRETARALVVKSQDEELAALESDRKQKELHTHIK
jgi:hypothetical protein